MLLWFHDSIQEFIVCAPDTAGTLMHWVFDEGMRLTVVEFGDAGHVTESPVWMEHLVCARIQNQ